MAIEYVQNGDVRLGYEVQWEGGAPGEGEPPVLHLHGRGGTMAVMRAVFGEGLPVMRRACRGHRLVTYDRRGYGASTREVGDHSLDAHVADAVAVARAVSDGPVILYGVSQSAFIAIAMAGRHPELVTKLIVAGGAAIGRNVARRELGVEFAVPDALETLVKLRWGIASRELASALNPDMPPEMFERYWRALAEETTPEAYLAEAHAVDEYDVRRELRAIRCPTMVMHGDEDRLVPLQGGEYIAKRIVGARFEVFEGGTHSFGLEDPDRFVKLVREFLGSEGIEHSDAAQHG